MKEIKVNGVIVGATSRTEVHDIFKPVVPEIKLVGKRVAISNKKGSKV